MEFRNLEQQNMAKKDRAHKYTFWNPELIDI